MSIFSRRPDSNPLAGVFKRDEIDPGTPIAEELASEHDTPQPVAGDVPRHAEPDPERGGWEVAVSYQPEPANLRQDPDLAIEGLEEPEGADGDNEPEEPEQEPSDEPTGQQEPVTGKHPCLCGLFERVNPDQPDCVTGRTECEAKTSKRFAPGHDAKLKSLLIAAGVHGERIRELNGKSDGKLHRPMTIANRFGFGEQVKRAINNRRRTW